jgi:hypothetical protein
LEYYYNGQTIPNAPESELTKATDMFESEGHEGLKKFLNTRDWGVIKSGYNISEVVNPSIRTYKSKPGVSKAHLKIKESIQYQDSERDIISRYFSYVRQMTLKNKLMPKINTLQTLFENNRNAMADPRKTADLLTRFSKELLGQKETPQELEKWLKLFYSQAARTLFTVDPRKGVRNLFQNAAFYTKIGELIKQNKLTGKDLEYFNNYVNQSSGIKKDLLYADVKINIPGIKQLNEIADVVDIMGKSDYINRLVAFRARLNTIKDYFNNNPDFNKTTSNLKRMTTKVGLNELEPMERKRALETLVTDGKDEFARYVSKGLVQKVHFLYTRYERGPAEMGSELSKILSNLLTFKKGYAQRQLFDLRKLSPKQKTLEYTTGNRKRSVRAVISSTVISSLIGSMYMMLTGDKNNPYDPKNILGDVSLGGLATGVQEDIGIFSRNTLEALTTGDKKAISQAINQLTTINDLYLPFYKNSIDAIESITGTKNTDKHALRQIRQAIDKRYKIVNPSIYKAERTLIQKLQHGIFGTKVEKKKTGWE